MTRQCEDPRFVLVLVKSKLTPGRKVWRLMLVEGKKTE